MQPSLLERYEALEQTCERMLAAAQNDNWDEVRRIGQDVDERVSTLRLISAGNSLSGTERREKFRILRRIVLIDAQIRHLSQPWQRDVDTLLCAPSTWQPLSVRPS